MKKEGMLTCQDCQIHNMKPEVHQRHVLTDRHKLLTKTFRPRLGGFLPRYTMVWCAICDDFFMITFEGKTTSAHDDEEVHLKAVAILQLFNQGEKPRTRTGAMCELTELKTTRVKMVAPLNSKYTGSKEALDSYKRVYKVLAEKRLVVE